MKKNAQANKSAKAADTGAGKKIITTNRKARYDYEIVESHEAGMALVGTEVKSIYLGKANLQDAFCRVENDEFFVHNLYIAPYENGGVFNVDSRRTRKLLMHRKEIKRIQAKALEKGYTLIPLSLYFIRGKAKLEVGLGRGKKQYDKREAIADRETRREQERHQNQRG